ncbi:DUF1732 domain-containing protein [Billgrantia gudaonensis]|uniref:DUF1732 domain-containing protein n=1 Tax=Billgrantia gudaonensis TaxID=376427 RepID=A0A432JGS9_9GAMM|nr:DUF1732 domain-containing protein [Halomonas gudaonensis]
MPQILDRQCTNRWSASKRSRQNSTPAPGSRTDPAAPRRPMPSSITESPVATSARSKGQSASLAPAGRRLTSLMQELNREANTLFQVGRRLLRAELSAPDRAK